MEAKVDVRKLQILNDRINQTIDALNQVRMSVHGLGHTGGAQPLMNPFVGQGLGQQQGLGMQNPYHLGTQSPFQGTGGQLGTQQGIQGFGMGLGFQHSPFTQYQNPFQNQFQNPFQGQLQSPVQNPYMNPYTSQGAWGGQSPLGGTPWGGLGGVAGGFGGGLFHSNPDFIDRQIAEFRASDPYRIAQTFPFVIG